MQIWQRSTDTAPTRTAAPWYRTAWRATIGAESARRPIGAVSVRNVTSSEVHRSWVGLCGAGAGIAEARVAVEPEGGSARLRA